MISLKSIRSAPIVQKKRPPHPALDKATANTSSSSSSSAARSMMRAVRVQNFGGQEVLQVRAPELILTYMGRKFHANKER